MKKYALIILSAILLLAAGLFYYSDQKEVKITGTQEQNGPTEAAKKDVRAVVWGQLPAQQKDEIDGTWKDGKVSKITLSNESVMRAIGDKSYTGEEVYFISFPSKLNVTIGDMVAYADTSTFAIIGYGLRD